MDVNNSSNNFNNILSPLTLLSLPPFIVYCIVNEKDKKFMVMGTESFILHYALFLKSLKRGDEIREDIFANKVELKILETKTNVGHKYFKINGQLLITKHYDSFIEKGYTPYRPHKLVRIEIVRKVQEDGRINLYARTARHNHIFLAQFNNDNDCTAYQERWYPKGEKVYKLFQA